MIIVYTRKPFLKFGGIISYVKKVYVRRGDTTTTKCLWEIFDNTFNLVFHCDIELPTNGIVYGHTQIVVEFNSTHGKGRIHNTKIFLQNVNIPQ